jgi:hypothetical protein
MHPGVKEKEEENRKRERDGRERKPKHQQPNNFSLTPSVSLTLALPFCHSPPLPPSLTPSNHNQRQHHHSLPPSLASACPPPPSTLFCRAPPQELEKSCRSEVLETTGMATAACSLLFSLYSPSLPSPSDAKSA